MSFVGPREVGDERQFGFIVFGDMGEDTGEDNILSRSV